MTNLLPMSLGDIFDESFDLYKRNFTLFAGIVAVVHVPLQIAVSALSHLFGLERLISESANSNDPDKVGIIMLGYFLFFMVSGLLYSFLFVIQNGALAIAISDRYLGHTTSIGAVYKRTLKSFLPLIITWFLIFVCMVMVQVLIYIVFIFVTVLVVGLAAVVFQGSSEAGAIITSIVLVVMTLLSLFISTSALMAMGGFITQIVVLEGRGYVDAIQRQWQLMKVRTWRAFWGSWFLLLITLLMFAALWGAVYGIMELVVYPTLHASDFIKELLQNISAALVWMFLQPYWMTCLTLLYYDQRVRGEAFDLAFLELQTAQNQAAA